MKLCLTVVCLPYLLVFLSLPAQGQLAEPTYYVVLGSFAVEANASSFIQELDSRQIKGQCFFNEQTQIYNVYAASYTSKELADSSARSFRDLPAFCDAWVKKFPPDEGMLSMTDSIAYRSPLNEQQNSLEKPKRTQRVQIVVADARTGRPINGRIQIVDATTTQRVHVAPSNTVTEIPVTEDAMHLLFICDVFGYRKEQLLVEQPIAAASPSLNFESSDSTWLVTFHLNKYHVGDITTLFNVYFYNDAAVMTAESKYQLDELVQLMSENPHMHIRLHGHCNGNYSDKIILPLATSNHFSLNKETYSINGSSRMLALKRAEAVRNYLVTHGISGHRMNVKSWGGRRPLFDKNSVHAKKNLRVDVEITRDN